MNWNWPPASRSARAPFARPLTSWRPKTSSCAARERHFVATHAEATGSIPLSAPHGRPPGRAERARASFLTAVASRHALLTACGPAYKPGEIVVEVRRVLSFSGRPVILDDIWLQAICSKGLTASDCLTTQGPMYGLFE